MDELSSLEPHQPIVFGGNRVIRVSPELAEAFKPGDRIVAVENPLGGGDLLHIEADDWRIAGEAVGRAHAGFLALGSVADAAITEFFDRFAAHLADDQRFEAILAANEADVVAARKRGRSTTRLELTAKMRNDMIEGLRLWRDASSSRNSIVETIEHQGWKLEQRQAGLGVVGFVFEGRPNVFADACGVLRSGNAVVFRIGSDALGTARAIVANALDPALEAAGLPVGTVGLIDSPAHGAGWAMFSDPRLSLAVARGSGPAVAQLGGVARQVGTPVSLHGTGGAWMMTGEGCDPDRLEAAVQNSLDRKVCNTLNTCCVLRSHAQDMMPRVRAGLEAAAAGRGVAPKIHVTESAAEFFDADWLSESVSIVRSEGPVSERRGERIDVDMLGHEWEWEESPELTVTIVESVGEAVELFNRHSPRFVASLVSDDRAEQDAFWLAIDAPFVGDGFTRWVDGQYALNRPELGLSNWQFGRLFGRGGVLSGDSVFTVRSRVEQSDLNLHR